MNEEKDSILSVIHETLVSDIHDYQYFFGQKIHPMDLLKKCRAYYGVECCDPNDKSRKLFLNHDHFNFKFLIFDENLEGDASREYHENDEIHFAYKASHNDGTLIFDIELIQQLCARLAALGWNSEYLKKAEKIYHSPFFIRSTKCDCEKLWFPHLRTKAFYFYKPIFKKSTGNDT